jgi:hypothetical protein
MADTYKIFVNKIITGDETWCFTYDPETKRQISEWVGETFPWPKKLKFQSSRIKKMLTNFRISRCSAQRIRTRGKTVHAGFYKGVMDGLLKRIERVRPAALGCRVFFWLHNNTLAHKATNVSEFTVRAKCMV